MVSLKEDTKRQSGGRPCEMEAETGVMLPQTKEPGAARSRKRFPLNLWIDLINVHMMHLGVLSPKFTLLFSNSPPVLGGGISPKADIMIRTSVQVF